MDPPKKSYEGLSLAEAKVIEKIAREIKNLVEQSGKKVFRRPRGRPRASESIQYYPITKPSSIPKRKRLKLTRKEMVQKRIVRYSNLVNEYKQLLFNKLRNVRVANRKLVRNVRNITTFFQRLPDRVEDYLMEHPVLPSKVIDKPLSAKLDKAIFFKEISGKLKHYEYTYLFDDADQSKINKAIKNVGSISEHIEALAETYVNHAIKAFITRLRSDILNKKVKLGFYAFVRFTCIYVNGPDQIEVYVTSLSHRRNEALVNKISDVGVVMRLLAKEVLIRMYELNKGSSGLSFLRVDTAKLELFYHEKPLINTEPVPLQSGKGWRQLPEWIRDSKSIVNIQNNDDSCFKWCVTRYFFEENGINYRVTNKLRKEAEKFQWFGLDNPRTFNEENLCKFEDHYNLRIIIFSITDKPGYSIMHMRGDKDKYDKKIYIGHYIDHFFIIRKLKAFIGVGAKINLATDHAIYICESCYSYFHKISAFRNHVKVCQNMPPEFKLPKKESYMVFNSYQKTLKYPAVCYADFEATTLPDNTQIPNSFAFFCPDFEILRVEYSPDPFKLLDKFWDVATQVYDKLMERYKANEKVQNVPSKIVDKCFLCKKEDVLVRHHDHYTGEFLGYACDNCNKKAKKPMKVRIFIHNLKGYDSHFIIKYGLRKYQQMLEELKAKDNPTDEEKNRLSQLRHFISVLGRSKEKLFYIKVDKFILQDSYCHLPFSLSQLIKDFVQERVFKSFLPDWYTHKEAYPYEWFNTYEKFEVPFLPDKDAFYSRLTGKFISDSDYNEAKTIFDKYCKTFKDYHEIYLKGDVVLLAEVFEKYRHLSLNAYHLDPAWYMSGPSFFYDAMKYMTGCKLPLIDDIDLYEMIKNGIRGGICNIGEKCAASANDKNCILYLDTANLYGKAMMEPLPTKILCCASWIEEKARFDLDEFSGVVNKIPNLEIINLMNNKPDNIGYIFVVDMHLPLELHDKFKAYPLFPEKIEGKLMQTLYPKKKYTVLDRYLLFGIKHGYVVTWIHNIIKIEQAPFMKKYIDYNTEQRKIATEKKETSKVTYFKNANNMVYGKNIENPEKYTKYIIKIGEDAIKHYNKPELYKNFIYIDEEIPILLFDQKVTTIKLDKPIIIGFCILDISKHIMAEHYCRLRSIFGDSMKLLYTDTDSLIIEVNGMNEKEALDLMKKHDPEEKYFELPGYREKKIPGRLALEKTCKYFRAFAAKHYICDKEEKCKGVPKNKTTTDHMDRREYYHIRSKNHVISIQKVEKKIKYSDDKKLYLSNGDVLPFGYKKGIIELKG